MDLASGSYAPGAVLDRAEQRRAIIQTAMDGFWLADASGRLVEVNDAYCTMSGYSEAELLSMLVSDLVADGGAGATSAHIATIMTRGEDRFESRHLRKNGTVFDVECAMRRQPDGRHFAGFIRDITADKRRSARAGLDRRVLAIMNQQDDVLECVRRVVSALKEGTGMDAVGIRLRDGDDFPYAAQIGFSEEHLAYENSLLVRDANNEICRDADGKAILECSCGLILAGKPHPGLTPGGSLWTDNAQASTDLNSPEDLRVNPRNLCVIEGYVSIAVVPITNTQETIGILHVADYQKGVLSLETVEMLEGIAAHIGQALTRKYAEKALLETNVRLEELLKSIVTTMGKVVEARDPYTRGHELRVAEISRQIAEAMGLPEHEVDGIEVAALVHDIGKLTVPVEILARPGELEDAEFQIIKRHSQEGYNILKDIHFDWPIAEIVSQHHERMDGSGYPQGLRGDDILMSARVIMAADVIEAMGADRPYRPALGLDAAMAEITGHPEKYDEQVISVCVELCDAGEIEL